MIKKLTVAVILILLIHSSLFSKAITHVSPIDGIDWTFETTMGWQNFGNFIMSKEGSSSTQTQEPLFFYGILYHAYYNKLPLIKAQMNLGFKDKTHIYWTESPDFNHSNQSLNELLRCTEVDAHWLLPSVIGYNGVFFPFVGYSYLNYSFSETFSSQYKTFSFHAFSVGAEYSTKINRSFSHNYYFSFAPIMLNNSGKKSYFYYNYGTELIINTHPIAMTLFLAFRNGFDKVSNAFDKKTYVFSNSELGLSFHINLNS